MKTPALFPFKTDSTILAAWLLVFWLVTMLQPWASASNPGRDVLQYFPLTPFLPADSPSRNYLQRTPPPSPWKPLPEPVAFTDLAVTNDTARAAVDGKSETDSSKKTDSKAEDFTIPSFKIPSFNFEKGSSKGQSMESVSPWFSISSETPAAQGMTSSSGGAGAAGVATNSFPAVIQRSIQGGASDIYVPANMNLPGNPPPGRSALIYTQPE
ncbi:MAG: hypothetical protein PHV34_21170 [Verrucomicrobiae bacterium]|nr:hypothetical protein [Verrucomicrobiae bacterium]